MQLTTLVAAKAGKLDGEEKSVAETLAWVRAKSAERRSRKLLAHFAGAEGKENEAGPPHQAVTSTAPVDVAASIARGQQILKDAEGNMTAFEKYMQDMKAGKVGTEKAEDDEKREEEVVHRAEVRSCQSQNDELGKRFRGDSANCVNNILCSIAITNIIAVSNAINTPAYATSLNHRRHCLGLRSCRSPTRHHRRETRGNSF